MRLQSWSRGKVGHYACAAGEGRLVGVALVGEGKPPRTATVNCPNCGAAHEVALAWRKPERLDEDREPELVIEATPEATTE